VSGGSWNYFYRDLENIAKRLLSTDTDESCAAQRIALGALLAKVSKALHAIEWVDSYDWCDGDEKAPLLEVLRCNPTQLGMAELEVRVSWLKAILDDMLRTAKEAQHDQPEA
jgi:hypothetical protein